MLLESYGIKLYTIGDADLERLRQWRNDPKINQYMSWRGHITQEMQKKWFVDLDKQTNYYMIIEKDNNKIGLVNLKDVSLKEMNAESGIFIYDDNYLNSLLPFQAIMSLLDFAFEELLLSSVHAHILAWNQRAIRFNSELGFVQTTHDPSKEMQLFTLTRESYFNNDSKIKSYLRKQKEKLSENKN